MKKSNGTFSKAKRILFELEFELGLELLMYFPKAVLSKVEGAEKINKKASWWIAA